MTSMRTGILLALILLATGLLKAQEADTTDNVYLNRADRLILDDRRLTLGGYGEVHYNKEVGGDTRELGKLDVHRVVLLFGYKFSSKTQFVTEIEFEHVSEVFVEQAFIQHRLGKSVNFRAGLLLIPMGIINEYHEPTTFNGVERPLIDKYIAPSTWREIGFGLTGNVFPSRMKYQVYVVNGFNSYDGSANLNGKNGLRKGRQKGAESFMSSPNFTAKVEFYGVRGLNIGLSGYFGNTQSTMYGGLNVNDDAAKTQADSTVVGVSMIGADARYSYKGFQARGQYYMVNLSNTPQYNIFTASEGQANDLGSSMLGYYIETGYNVFRLVEKWKTELIPFVRYEAYNTHNSVAEGIEKNLAYDNTILTTGITWKLAQGAVLKADVQFLNNAKADNTTYVFNAGFGVMF